MTEGYGGGVTVGIIVVGCGGGRYVRSYGGRVVVLNAEVVLMTGVVTIEDVVLIVGVVDREVVLGVEIFV